MNSNLYFDKFNTVDFNGSKTKDILTSYYIYENKKYSNFFYEYNIDGDKSVEQIAYEVYGDPSLYWTILLVNNIQDVFTELPMSDSELKQLAEKKLKENNLEFKEFYNVYTELEEENDKKRNIKIIRPDLMNRFLVLLEEA